MPSLTLTDAAVRSLKAPPGQRLVRYDSVARGLCLRVTERTKSFSFIYRPKGRPKQKRLTIGDYPAWSLSQARETALELRRRVQQGGDPVAEEKQRRLAMTVGQMIERWFAVHQKKQMRSAEAYYALLIRNVVPAMAERPASDVARVEVGIFNKILDRAPVVANRVQNTLSSVFSWAVSEGLVTQNPVMGLRKRHMETAKTRVLSDDEIRGLWAVTENETSSWRDVLRLILRTAQRPGEVCGIRREEVNVDAAEWTIPGARTKNKREHRIPLVGEAYNILRPLVARRGDGPLILSPRGLELFSQDVAKAVERMRGRGGLFRRRQRRTTCGVRRQR